MAISFDAVSGQGTGTGTTVNASMTVGSISNGLLLAFIQYDGTTDDVTGVTWNSSAMTRIFGAKVGKNNTNFLYIYGILNPASGTHNITVTKTGTSLTTTFYGVSYSGVNQSVLPGSIDKNGSAVGSGSSTSVSLTTTVDNDWIAGIIDTASGGTQTAGSNTTQRVGTIFNFLGIYDTNAAQTPVGAHALNVTQVSGVNWGFAAVAFSPAVAPTTNGNFLMFM